MCDREGLTCARTSPLRRPLPPLFPKSKEAAVRRNAAPKAEEQLGFAALQTVTSNDHHVVLQHTHLADLNLYLISRMEGEVIGRHHAGPGQEDDAF